MCRCVLVILNLLLLYSACLYLFFCVFQESKHHNMCTNSTQYVSTVRLCTSRNNTPFGFFIALLCELCFSIVCLLLLRDKTYLCAQNRSSNIVPATCPEGEMTKEDVSEPVEGDTLLDCHTRQSSHQRPIIHQVASAPMPSDCGEDPHMHTFHTVERFHISG